MAPERALWFMRIMRHILRQTGAIFIWASEKGSGVTAPSFVSIALIALCGGILGVLFMVPLRTALIVEEHGVLPYPEGTACAEVLLAGEEGATPACTLTAEAIPITITALSINATAFFFISIAPLIPFLCFITQSLYRVKV